MNANNPEHRDVTLSRFVFWAVAAVAAFGVFAIIWFGVPRQGNNLRLVSPSGRHALEMGEVCGDFSCRRVIIHESGTGSQNPVRSSCAFEVESSQPVFNKARADWNDGETGATIIFTDDFNQEFEVPLEFDRDCLKPGD